MATRFDWRVEGLVRILRLIQEPKCPATETSFCPSVDGWSNRFYSRPCACSSREGATGGYPITEVRKGTGNGERKGGTAKRGGPGQAGEIGQRGETRGTRKVGTYYIFRNSPGHHRLSHMGEEEGSGEKWLWHVSGQTSIGYGKYHCQSWLF